MLGAGHDGLDVMDEFVADEADGAAGEAGQAGHGHGAVLLHQALDHFQAVLHVLAHNVAGGDAAVLDDLHVLAVLADDGAGIAANKGVAAKVLAALDGFEEERLAGAADFAVGGEGRFQVGQNASRNGNKISLRGELQEFIGRW